MSKALFIFAQINPLDSVPLDSIVCVQLVADKAVFTLLNDEGKRIEIIKPRTPFIEKQIDEYAIEKSEV